MAMTPFDRLQGDMSGFMRASALAALAELDFGSVILRNGNCLGAAEVARLCSCDRRGTEALLDALSAMGYLEKSGTGGAARYRVAEEYAVYLDSAHPFSHIPMMRHMAGLQRSWAQLARSVKEGRPQKREPGLLGAEEEGVSFIMGMNSAAIRLIGEVMASLAKAGVLPFRKPDARILDVGGASGSYTQAFLEKSPESTAAIFDLPIGIEQARKRFQGGDMAQRISLIEGDFTKDPLPSGFDFVWLSAIIHQMNRDESKMLYAKIFDALNPGGMAAVRDYVMDETRTRPADGALFGLNMLVNTRSGMVYTFAEIKEDMEQAGFVDVALAVDAPSMAAVATGKKPG